MRASKRLIWFFELAIVRWLVIILVTALLLWFSWPRSNAGYEFNRTETVEVLSVRPFQSQHGGERYLLSFILEDGRVDSMSLPKIDSLKSGHKIQIDILTKPNKKNRYRLAQPPVEP